MPRRIAALLLALLAPLVALVTLPASPAGAQSTIPALPAWAAGLTQVKVSYGEQVTVQYTGDVPDFVTPVVCGDLGCTYHRIGWGLPPGAYAVAGCSGTDISCTFQYTPLGLADAGEAWAKLTVAHLVGSAVYDSTDYALLGTVGYYPVYFDATAAEPDRSNAAPTLFVVKSGSNPDVSTCSTGTYDPAQGSWPQTTPTCFKRTSWSGVAMLPDQSTWDLLATFSPSATGAVRAQSGLNGFSSSSVTVTGDNLYGWHTTHVDRPMLGLTVTAPAYIPIKTTTTVYVTVTADGGAGGSIKNVTLPNPILKASHYASLSDIKIVTAPTVSSFDLASGGSKTFAVVVQGTGATKNGWLYSEASGVTDEGLDRLVMPPTVTVPVVDTADPPPPVEPPGATAPPAPVVTSAASGPGGWVEGTASGQPGDTVTVTLVSATGATCPRQLTGAGVTPLGTVQVTLPTSGQGAFHLASAPADGSWVYGTTTADGKTSDVSGCTVAHPPLTVSAAAAVSGKPTVGALLQASGGDFSPTATRAVQWLRDGEPIGGASADSYRLAAADFGAHISVRVTGTLDGYAATTSTSPDTKVIGQAVATASASLPKAKVAKGKKAKVKAQVTALGVTPRGTVVVKEGKKTLVSTALSGGKATLTLPLLAPGKHTLVVVYQGSPAVASDKAKAVTLTVTR